MNKNIRQLQEQLINDLQQYLHETKNQLDSIISSYQNSPSYTVAQGGGSISDYVYYVYPFKHFDGTRPADENYLADMMAQMIEHDMQQLKEETVIVTFEADGIEVSTLISTRLNIPFVVCKTFDYHQDVFSFIQKTGYYERVMYCPRSVLQAKRIIIVDCIVSTGGTVQGFLKALKSQAYSGDIVGIYTIANKTLYQRDSVADDPKALFAPVAYRFCMNIETLSNGTVQVVFSRRFLQLLWDTLNHNVMHCAYRIAEFSDVSRNTYKIGALLIDTKSLEILGWGRKESVRHAEAGTLEMARKRYNLEERELTLYTTTEPCVYRTIEGQNSCCSIIEGIPAISRIIIGELDWEDAKNLNQGVNFLRKIGRQVEVLDISKKNAATEQLIGS